MERTVLSRPLQEPGVCGSWHEQRPILPELWNAEPPGTGNEHLVTNISVCSRSAATLLDNAGCRGRDSTRVTTTEEACRQQETTTHCVFIWKGES
jgi:hypothetical protein